MYRKLLERAAEEQQAHQSRLQPPATIEQIESLQLKAIEQLGMALPTEYTDFLKSTNGYAWNGVSLYPSENSTATGETAVLYGILEQNAVFLASRNYSEFILIGEDNLDYYLYNTQSRQYEARDRVPLDYAYETFGTFKDLAEYAINKSLGQT
ncbi:MAG: YrhA family protein [Stenotrophomonas sp.]|uniref:YrhA family protein n=1 Tax=Stenotrophomonas sp. TaxID=69392 RepID=UPI003D6DA13B